MRSNNPHHEGEPSAITFEKGTTTIYPRGLNITWGKDGRYWKLPDPRGKARIEKRDLNSVLPFSDEPAELLQVCWLEVTGSVDAHPRKDYEVIFKLSMTQDAFGWGDCPVYVMVKRGKEGKFTSKKCRLTASSDPEIQLAIKSMSDKEKPNSTDSKLYFGLYEVWSDKWKGGLKIHRVIVKDLSAGQRLSFLPHPLKVIFGI